MMIELDKYNIYWYIYIYIIKLNNIYQIKNYRLLRLIIIKIKILSII